jgi:hypothetical protein
MVHIRIHILQYTVPELVCTVESVILCHSLSQVILMLAKKDTWQRNSFLERSEISDACSPIICSYAQNPTMKRKTIQMFWVFSTVSFNIQEIIGDLKWILFKLTKWFHWKICKNTSKNTCWNGTVRNDLKYSINEESWQLIWEYCIYLRKITDSYVASFWGKIPPTKPDTNTRWKFFGTVS